MNTVLVPAGMLQSKDCYSGGSALYVSERLPDPKHVLYQSWTTQVLSP